MFTGLISEVGSVVGLARTPGGARLSVKLGDLAADTKLGDSVSVSGVCLTIAQLSRSVAAFDVVRETLECTTLAAASAGAKVNLEAAIRAGEPFGGHFVTGHVDGVATCRSRRQIGEGAEVSFELEDALLADIVEKGSVAIDGVSLTVAKLEQGTFTVALIPHTLRSTTLGDLAPGSRVNVETDMLVKAVRRIISRARGGKDVSLDFLREHGFA